MSYQKSIDLEIYSALFADEKKNYLMKLNSVQNKI